jgi:SAM-dependent methyltransferase
MTLAEEDGEVSGGLLHCAGGHWFPVAGGIPRMLPDSLKEHWPSLKPHMAEPLPQSLREAVGSSKDAGAELDRRTRANFSEEWNNHDLGGKTWGMELDDRVNWFFLEPIRIPAGELRGKVMLDAGCGNGSQSVAYTRFGVEVIAMDLSTGLERGYAFRRLYAGGDASKVHFVQADLQRPPLAPHSVDLIHSAGVLHHTPNTLKTFRALFPLLKPGGTFYVWLYKYEPVVTPIVNSIRAITTHIPAPSFAVVAKLMSPAFQAFCAGVNALGVRSYPRLDRREAALALMDIFGAPYAHYHSFDEVKGWYDAMGFAEVWACNDGRRGFGVCGRLSGAAEEGAGG